MLDADQELRRGLERLTDPTPGHRPASWETLVARRRRRRVRRAAATGLPAALLVGALILAARPFGGDAEVRTDVVTSPDPTTVPTTSTAPAPMSLPGLEEPAPGREVTFDGIGDVRLGDPVDPSTVDTIGEGDDCGWWGPLEPSHDGDEPLRGEVRGASSSQPTVSRIKVFENPTYRTAAGVGIGTPLDTLRQVYGDRLVVDPADGWEQPTDGLLALYTDVAAVREDANALTFLLRDDVVESIKLSTADDWGDDEGCA